MPRPPPQKIALLATGGTIAGVADGSAGGGYRAAQLGVEELVAAAPGLAATSLVTEQVAQIDSKDMSPAVWRLLAQRTAHHLGRPDIAGVVITHGTDTLEETAYFLHRLLAPGRPVVLTGAMRPAGDLLSDGPRNLLDAVRVARCAQAHGVVAVLAGAVHAAAEVYKAHPTRLDAFSSGDAGPIACLEPERLRMLRPWPAGQAIGLERLPSEPAGWPVVEIVASHAGADGRVVQALQLLGVQGIVVAATGNGSVHAQLQATLASAHDAGIEVLISSRCHAGPMVGAGATAWPRANGLTPAKARVELMLSLLERR